jgi:redox-sensing transcriptional repressor
VVNLKKILGLDKTWNVALCGLGNLGKALAFYKRFSQQGFVVRVIFEKDVKKVGKKFNGIDVLNVDEIPVSMKGYRINIAVLSLPQDQAQGAAQALYDAGVRAILNFAPININLPADCFIRNVYMSSEFTYLSYSLGHKRRNLPKVR